MDGAHIKRAKMSLAQRWRENGRIVGQIFALIRQNKKWWLLPIFLMFISISFFMLLVGGAPSCRRYTRCSEMAVQAVGAEAGAIPTNRSFGFTITFLFVVVGIAPLRHGHGPRAWALIVAGGALLLALTAPALLGVPNRLWTGFGRRMGKITNPIMLGLLFFIVVTPIGLLMRIFRRDPMGLRREKKLNSYWQARPVARPADLSMQSQF